MNFLHCAREALAEDRAQLGGQINHALARLLEREVRARRPNRQARPLRLDHETRTRLLDYEVRARLSTLPPVSSRSFRISVRSSAILPFAPLRLSASTYPRRYSSDGSDVRVNPGGFSGGSMLRSGHFLVRQYFPRSSGDRRATRLGGSSDAAQA